MLQNLTRNALALAVGTAFAASSAHAFVVNETFSGSWAERQGTSEGSVSRGLVFDIIEDHPVAGDFAPALVAYWYTYDENGDPLWLIVGPTRIDPNTNSVDVEFLEFSGGAFDPSAVIPDSDVWGTGTITFNSCTSGVLEYNGPDGSGSIDSLVNLTSEECVVDEVFQSCPDFATSGPVDGSCVLEGEISGDVTLTNETLWLLSGQVRVLSGASLTIEPNTEIVGGALDAASFDTLVVAQGGQIFAEGTPENPIVMRGVDPLGEVRDDLRGQWGGLVVNGFAPINGCVEGQDPCTAEGEGDTGTYGGNDPRDNSGVMRYMIVSNAGFQFTEEDELNGIALQGVGDATTFEKIQVHLNADDGIEFFGGTVNGRGLVLTGIGDDSIDWTQGWQGDVQYAVVKQYTDDGDQGIEGDNNGDANDSEPRALPIIANATFIGSSNADIGWLIREGSGASIANSIVTGFGEACVDIDQESTFNNADNLTFANNVIGVCGDGPFDEEDGDPLAVSSLFSADQGNVQADPMLMNYAPMASSPALNIGAVPYADGFFDNVNYAGAIPSADADWTAGWTVGLDRDTP
jgi:hypothetical protein